MQELRFALRALGRNPGFTIAAVATLALAIGANTVMFSVLNAVLLRPLPYPFPGQLTMVWTGTPGQGLREGRSAYLSVDEWRRQSRSFAGLAVIDPVSVTLTSADGAERISVARISPDFFPLLGVQPLHGRIFSAAEADQRQRVAVISHRFWQTRFGGSPAAIGASLLLDGLPSEIVGILPADFQLARLAADVWEPHTLFPDWEARRGARGAGSWFVVGRVRPDVTVDQAQVEMSAIARRLDEQRPASERNRGISVVPLSLYAVGSRSRLALWMLTGAVVCVLLIAAANVASLLLARSVGRAREMAIRAALGAGPGRIVRLLLAESVTLAGISGVVGSLLAAAAIPLIRAFGPADLARLNEVSLDLRALGWALAVSFVAGILVGLAPAITIVRWTNVRPAGEEGGRSVAGGAATRRIRRGLVVGEFALAIVLLAGAGLLIRSWWSLERVDPGFMPERVLSMQLSTTAFTGPAQRASFYDRALEQIESVPGVERAGIIGDLFVSSDAEQIVTTDGDVRDTSERLRIRRDEVSGGLFSTIGTRLLRGRFFSAADGPASPPVAIVNDTMARRLWPARDPLGRRFKLGPEDSASAWFTVVGVVGDMRRQGLERDAIPQMFEPLARNPSRLATLLVRTSAEPLTMVGPLQAAVRRVDKQAPLYGVTTLEDRLGADLAPRRFQTAILIGFSLVALLMAAIGIYGLVQYSVAIRTHEIGIRMAVGAQAGDIFSMIIGEGLTLSLGGLAIGLVGALWMGHAGASLLFGVGGTDPLTFASVSLLLTAVAAAACYLPARRAMRVEPIVALRQR